MNLKDFGSVKEHAPIKNTYQIKATTRYLLLPSSIENTLKFLKYQKKENFPYFVIGSGSNVILSDGEYPGVVVSLENLNEIVYEKNRVTVGAGVKMAKFGMDIINHGLKGLEWAIGIPGTVGGGIFGNAEAYKVSTFEYLESVTYITKDLEIVTRKKDELSHGYRTSYFKENPGNVILFATFVFQKGNKEESLILIEERRQRRMSTQPLEYPSAGSVFRNPSPENPSWKLIDTAGLKGKNIGGAYVSEKHANFIINKKNATGKDIRNLIHLVSETVKKETDIDLVLEQEYKDW